jgi:cytochrome c oxidase subunit 2
MRRVLLVSMLAASFAAAAAGDPEAGKATYVTCSACHGPQGEGMQALSGPKLSGLGDWYLARQIHNFKSGIRGSGGPPGSLMAPMVAALDDAAVENVVAYIQTLPDTPAPVTVQGDADRGKQYFGTCAACHGAAGEGNQALNAPRVAGMSDWYLVRQLQDFKSGARGKHPQDSIGVQMAPMAAMLADDQAINDVVAYINTMR